MKKTKATHHENHERWLVSYADFITLLFAFFVVMFATAQQDKGKAKEVAESVREALNTGNSRRPSPALSITTRQHPMGKGSPGKERSPLRLRPIPNPPRRPMPTW